MALKQVKLDKVASVVGTDEAERFHLSSSKNNSPVITIDNFELGSDKLHYGNAHGYQLEWIDAGHDNRANDLQITIGSQQFILTDLLGDQLKDPVEYRSFQGFETDTDGILDSTSAWFGTVARVPSGTDGVLSASGGFHALFEQTADTGPFTRYGDYQSSFIGEWTASVDVYLDVTANGGGWTAGEGFDFSSAVTGSDGAHQRDFIFHVTQDTSTGQLLINASNNTNFDPREDLEFLAGTATINNDGWYTFQHRFYDNGGVLAADLKVLDANGAEVFAKTLSDASDVISDIGGNRYGWFTNIDVAGGIAVDNLALAYASEQIANNYPVPAASDLFFVF